MKQERLRLYTIDMKYIRNLSHADNNVMSVSPQIGKSTRPFVGIIVICDEKQYCVPLSSPKSKHYKMNNDTDFSKIFDGDKLIGFVNGSFAFEEGELLNIAVEEDYRRQGIAQMLFDTLFQHFTDMGVEKIFLEVREKNTPAVGFYKKNGFAEVGLRKNYYREPTDHAVIMKFGR